MPGLIGVGVLLVFALGTLFGRYQTNKDRNDSCLVIAKSPSQP